VRVLGIETSCDETAVAVIARGADGRGEILANVVRSQFAEHAPYGGVVPEIAARAHLACLDELTAAALRDSGCSWHDLDLIAATAGPGLIGGLLVGLSFAKSAALAARKPLAAINHLEGHALTAGLTDGVRPPYILLLVSGGHTQTLLVEAVGQYRRIGTTIDDALGEAFDKTAKLLDLPAPGGPAVEAMAKSGDRSAHNFPRPMMQRGATDFSFAGLKTAVRRAAELGAPLSDRAVADICASFQAAVTEVIARKCGAALDLAPDLAANGAEAATRLVVAGGVAANAEIRSALAAICATRGVELIVPPPSLCTDNGAMIAWAAAERAAAGLIDDGLSQSARARWPLDATAPSKIGYGRRGAKA
jgi:N6-L-threonylcarbamoyladenine synthase